MQAQNRKALLIIHVCSVKEPESESEKNQMCNIQCQVPDNQMWLNDLNAMQTTILQSYLQHVSDGWCQYRNYM